MGSSFVPSPGGVSKVPWSGEWGLVGDAGVVAGSGALVSVPLCHADGWAPVGTCGAGAGGGGAAVDATTFFLGVTSLSMDWAASSLLLLGSWTTPGTRSWAWLLCLGCGLGMGGGPVVPYRARWAGRMVSANTGPRAGASGMGGGRGVIRQGPW